MELVKMTRSTRGKGTRIVEFEGIVVAVPKVGEDGKPELTNTRDGSPGDPVMVAVEISYTIGELLRAIATALKDDAKAIALTLAKTFNAIQFSAAVEATASVVEDLLSPVFVELGYTDEAAVTKLRRTVSMIYSFDSEKDVETEAERKIEILRLIHSQSK